MGHIVYIYKIFDPFQGQVYWRYCKTDVVKSETAHHQGDCLEIV